MVITEYSSLLSSISSILILISSSIRLYGLSFLLKKLYSNCVINSGVTLLKSFKKQIFKNSKQLIMSFRSILYLVSYLVSHKFIISITWSIASEIFISMLKFLLGLLKFITKLRLLYLFWYFNLMLFLMIFGILPSLPKTFAASWYISFWWAFETSS